jgi:serine/threonine-protein kinase HipA
MNDSPDVRRLRSVDVADVLKGERLAATLERSSEGIAFRYVEDYVRAGGPPVATTLPVTLDPIITVAGSVPPFFAGLLPEGRRLTALRDALKTSLDDELSLVLAIGADPVGDVRVVPAGVRPAIPEPTVAWRDGADLSFRDVIADSGLLERRGMAGVQDKASAAMITVPASSSGQDAILKLTPPEYPHLVENEAWFLALARRAGLPVPAFRVITDRTGERGLLIERFDRRVEDDRVERHAVEDGAQVLGIYPSDKYRVTTEQVAQALIAPCQARRVAARDLLRSLLFAWLTGNGDLHAKNASILQVDGEWRIAPLYDVPSTLPYGDDTMALTLSGRDHDLSRKAFLQFAEAIDLPAAAAVRAIDEMLAATEPVLQVFADQVEPFTRPRNAEALAQVKRRRRLLSTA